MTPKWIVGVDGSDVALAALRWAVAHAPLEGADIEAVTAYHVPLSLTVLAAKRGFDADRLGMEAEARHVLDEAVSAVGVAPDEVATCAVEGAPASTLLEAASEDDATMLVVGRRGHSALRHLVLGSVSSYCATHAPVPVAVVPPDWKEDRFESIVVGFDGSENARAALAWAIDVAPDDTDVVALIAIEPAPWIGEDVTLARFPDEIRAEEERIVAAADEVDPEHRAERRVQLHGPRDALANAAGVTDLLVVGTRGHGRISAALLGSVSTWLLHHAPCPVVVVPHPEPAR